MFLFAHNRSARRVQAEGAVNLLQRRQWFTDPPAAPPAPPAPPPAPTPAPTPTPAPPAPPATPPGQQGDVKAIEQEKVNKLVGDARKEGREAGLADFFKELGVENADALKKLVQAKNQADEANKTELQKAQEKAAQLEQQLNTEKSARQQLEQQQRIATRDNAIRTALKENRSTKPDNVLVLMGNSHPDMVKATLKDDGTIDTEAVKKLVDEARKQHKEYFIGSGPGSTSHATGQNPDRDTSKPEARDKNFRRMRRNV